MELKNTPDSNAKISLFDWQKPSRDKLVQIFQNGSLIAGNWSDCGSGKTYIAIDVARILGKRIFVICPKAVISAWRRVAQQMSCPDILVEVINMGKLITGRTPWLSSELKWNIPEGTLVVWDEVHQGQSNPNTKSNKILAMTRAYKLPVLAMSATPAATPLAMRGIGYLFDFHRFSKGSFYDWAARQGCYRNPWNGYAFPKGPKGQAVMAKLGEQMSDRSVRLRIEDIPEFPACETEVELVDLSEEETKKVNEAYADMVCLLAKPNPNPLVCILRARQIAEIQKVTVLEDKVLECLEQEHSAVVFLNFRESQGMLVEQLEARGLGVSVIHGVQGDQEQREREQAIQEFQENRNHVAVVICAAGGAGIGLHDQYRVRPRRAFISPDFSSTIVRQVLGRIHRAGATKAIQTFILAANTAEEKVYTSVVGKMKNLDALLDAEVFDLTKH